MGSGKYLIGVDIGGTALKVGVVDFQGSVVIDCNVTLQDKTFSGVCDLIVAQVHTLTKQLNIAVPDDIHGVGIVMPGKVDPHSGVVVFAANLPSWKNVAMASELEEKLGIRPTLENDANVALLAEVWCGAAKGLSNACIVTLGTGVGGAVVCNGHLLRGRGNMAAEIGHSICELNGRVSENTGVKGVFEEYISARAIGKIAQEVVAERKQKAEGATGGSGLESHGLNEIDAKLVFDLAKKGDETAVHICDKSFEYLGMLCVNLSRFYDPEVIILTGGMIAAGEYLLNGVRRAFKKHWWSIAPCDCRIELASLGTKTGIIGAAFLQHPDAAKILL